MKRLLLLGLVAFALTACAAPTAATKTTTPRGAATSSLPPLPEESASSAASSQVAAIGSTEGFTYADGLQVFVVSAKRYVRGQYAAGGKVGDAGVIVLVRVRNGSSKVVDLTLAQVDLSAGPTGNSAERLFDEHVGSGFTLAVAPGHTAQAQFGFSVNPADLPTVQIQVTPTFDYAATLFEGSVTK